jgi:hypothetical protein
MIRVVIIPIRASRVVITKVEAPSSVGVTFHILTETGLVLDTEAADQMRTE